MDPAPRAAASNLLGWGLPSHATLFNPPRRSKHQGWGLFTQGSNDPCPLPAGSPSQQFLLRVPGDGAGRGESQQSRILIQSRILAAFQMLRLLLKGQEVWVMEPSQLWAPANSSSSPPPPCEHHCRGQVGAGHSVPTHPVTHCLRRLQPRGGAGRNPGGGHGGALREALRSQPGHPEASPGLPRDEPGRPQEPGVSRRGPQGSDPGNSCLKPGSCPWAENWGVGTYRRLHPRRRLGAGVGCWESGWGCHSRALF